MKNYEKELINEIKIEHMLNIILITGHYRERKC